VQQYQVRAVLLWRHDQLIGGNPLDIDEGLSIWPRIFAQQRIKSLTGKIFETAKLPVLI
jgi:hypothetical protein